MAKTCDFVCTTVAPGDAVGQQTCNLARQACNSGDDLKCNAGVNTALAGMKHCLDYARTKTILEQLGVKTKY